MTDPKKAQARRMKATVCGAFGCCAHNVEHNETRSCRIRQHECEPVAAATEAPPKFICEHGQREAPCAYGCNDPAPSAPDDRERVLAAMDKAAREAEFGKRVADAIVPLLAEARAEAFGRASRRGGTEVSEHASLVRALRADAALAPTRLLSQQHERAADAIERLDAELADAEATISAVIEMCDVAEAIDLEHGRTLITRRDVGRGDLITNDVRNVASGKWSVEEFGNKRREVFEKAKAMTDKIWAARKATAEPQPKDGEQR